MTTRKGVIIQNRGLFSSATTTAFVEPSARSNFDGFDSLSGSVGTGSFDLDSFGSAFKSTQQLPINWAEFKNHTFFDSAESKVNVAFDTIINFFPFDSSKEEIREYMEGLTGFERWLYDYHWPKYKGYLHFSGTTKIEDPAHGYPAEQGTFISVVDQAGYLYPTISKRRDNEPIINFATSPFTCAFHINLPTESNSCSTILQKLSQDHGFSVFVSGSSSADTADIVFMLSSGSVALSASATFEKSDTKFHHCAAVLTRRQNENPTLLIYKDARLAGSSSQTATIGQLNFLSANLLIGSGTDHYLGTYSTNFQSETTLSGALDDLRLYGSEKNASQIEQILSGNSDIDSSTLMYYKFNEATGSYDNNSVVLDHSGNSLHAQIRNYNTNLRVKGSLIDPVKNEDVELNPCLFPSQQSVIDLNRQLLISASNYDANNPNLITRLIPQHYLEEEAYSMGYSNAEAGIGDPYSYTSDFPGGGDPGSPQLIASLLFMWAKFFDEVKMFIDQFGQLLNLDYDDSGKIADIMLPFFAKYYGISLPNMFSGATVQQYLRGQNISVDGGATDSSLAKIQAQIWRRILINIQDTIRSKGTIHGIKSIMRASGINPDTMFRFREYGGPRELSLTDSRTFRHEVTSLLQLSSGSQVRSNCLSGSRVEAGTPLPAGTFIDKVSYPPHGRSNYVWDGLLTSGSWTVEFVTKPQKPALMASMSLGRMYSTGTAGQVLLANCIGVGVGTSTARTGSLSVFHRPLGEAIKSKALELHLTGADIFDGNTWHVSFGREMLTQKTSSFFLRAGRQSNGVITDYYSTFTTASFGTGSYYCSGSTQHNASGSFIEFGSGSVPEIAAGLNSSIVSSHAKLNFYSGSIGRIRFWTKALTPTEDKEHVRNYKSLGVENPLTNFNFVTNATGSFERLRLDASCDQIVSESNASGQITIFDYSQNLLHMTGSGFPSSKKVMEPYDVRYTMLDPKFDERSTANKIRIAGFQFDENIDRFNTLKSPVRSIPLGTPVYDDTRFSIEISSARALNDDIMLLLGSLDFFDDALGSPELLFAQDYPDLVALRTVYFNRLTDKINYKNLVSFYKWIDGSIGFLVARMIPSNTSFLGMNFVIESHVLERNKLRYLQEDIYIGENDRRGLQTDLGLQQVVGSFKRY